MAEKERWPVCSFMGDGEAVAVPHSKLKKKGGPLGMVCLCLGLWKWDICFAPSPDRHLVPHVTGVP